MPIRVAVDAMGGDHAPDVVVEAAANVAAKHGDDVAILLVGPSETVRGFSGVNGGGLEVVDAPQVIDMAESPAAALKQKPKSSIHVGLGLVKAGQADAFASAGNTGAVMAASLFILGRLPGVARPAILGLYPTLSGFTYVIDVGANVDCKPEHLVQFADMATIYVERVLKKERPTVGLLSVGEERTKGNELTKEAFGLLESDSQLNFIGNIEGRDIMEHAADIVVCDGFVGNVILKLGESIATVIPQLIGREMKRQALAEDAQKMVGGVLHGVNKSFDYEEYGGMPLLGVNGTVFIGHGGSSVRAIENMILAAANVAKRDVTGSIQQALGSAAES
ncbi:MAG: phosphate acyltransferase PlsX [Rhodothermales bacterium]|nr:phosphate acyltransferase PlsX [Rhodothermales bacterium]